MKFWYLFLFLVLAMNFCTSDKSSSSIPLEKLGDIMADIYNMQAVYESLPSSVKDSMVNKSKLDILNRYQVTDSLFNISLNDYNKNAKALIKLEKRIKLILLQKIEVDSIQKEFKKTLIDSLN
ncbi:MAG: DUF4296 domain-containing protein [Saprospiraceae bacterium]